MTKPGTSLSYLNSKFFRVVKTFGIFGGDIIENDGSSGETIYGMTFRDENYAIMHDSKYLLSLTKPNKREHTNNS